MKHSWRNLDPRALACRFLQSIIHVPVILKIKDTNIVATIPKCYPIQLKLFPNTETESGVFDNLLCSVGQQKTQENDLKFNIERGLLTLTPAQCHDMFALPFSSIVTSSVKGVPSEGWLPNFLPQLESGGCNQSSRASRNALLLICWEGCGSITDNDWTVCTCNGQLFRQQVDVMMLVR